MYASRGLCGRARRSPVRTGPSSIEFFFQLQATHTMAKSLTKHLLSLHEEHIESATHHPWLKQAGEGNLSSADLARWLTQDRLYGLMGYTRLMGGLMSKLPSQDVGPDTPHAKQMWSRLRVLSGATANITREMGFFEDVARKNNLPLDVPQDASSLLGLLSPVTQGYIDYMANVAAHGTFEEAMILLWSMEVLYLKAWSYAAEVKRGRGSAAPTGGDANANAALDELIPNWASKEFEHFVDEIAHLVDEIGAYSSPEQIKRYEEVWARCLWFEERFWTGEV